MARSKAARKGANPPAVPRLFSLLYSLIALLALAGLADALYLAILHLTGQSALCGGSASCSEVLASRYAHLGPVPVAAFGVLGYFTVFASAVFAAFRYARARRVLVVAVAFMFLGTLWFLFVQAVLLHQYCRFCLFSAAITFLLTGLVVAMPLPSRSPR